MTNWLRRPSVLAGIAAGLIVLAVLVLFTLKTIPDCWKAHPSWTAAQCLTDLARRTAPPAIRKLLPPQLTLSWTDNSGGQAGVRVERKTGTGGAYAQIAELPAGTTSLVDPAVATTTTYCYRVKAFNAEGESAPTNEACGTVASATTYPITVSLSGTGSVTSSPSGIICAPTCTASFPSGSLVTLTASGVSGSMFSGWSGACSGTAPCAITGNVPISVTATFAAAPPTSPLTLTVGVSGSGTVTSTPAGIACPATKCSASFPAGTAVSMTATAASGWTFYSWSGGLCSGSGSCVVTTSGLVVANFSTSSPPPAPPPTVPYTLTVAISGQGSVSSSPAGITCGADCSGSYPAGTAVTLTGVPRSGWQLTGWSVPWCSGSACTITVNGNITVSAKFARQKKL
jgi:hypothetical protein